MARDADSCAERYPPIGDYALIGDCHTAALISRDGSVDWYCPGRFDAPAVFCRLLDTEQGGFLRLAPVGRFVAQRQYRGLTNVLETTFRANGGTVRVTHLMPIHRRKLSRAGYDVGTSNQLLRLVEGIGGEVELELHFKPTFDYAHAAAELSLAPGAGALAHGNGRYLTLTCPGIGLESDGAGGLRGRLRLRAGERSWVALTDTKDADRAREALAITDCSNQLDRTLEYWEEWAAGCTYRGPYQAEVIRSALVLKLLDYEPTGAIVAAPTTSLPETVGGVRNWDYRYAWLRDSALILYALMAIGYHEEALDFFSWLDRVSGLDVAPTPQIMYGIGGEQDLPEVILDHLEGYRCSRPVRIGNAAAQQRQLDVFGEVLSAAYLCYRSGGAYPEGEPAGSLWPHRPLKQAWTLLRWLVEQAAERWTEPDHGIWEVRGGPRHFLSSKLMCWAALDRRIRLAGEYGLAAPTAHWGRTREAIRTAILEQGYDAKRGAFTQSFGSPVLDTSALRVPATGFLPPTDPRVRSTVQRIQHELTQQGLVYRYDTAETADGLPGGEATFAPCSFWLVDALALGGRVDEAQALFERVVGYANDVGLLAEEIDPGTGELLGNFPQGLLAATARQHAEAQQQAEGLEQEPSEGQSWHERITSVAGWRAIADAFFHEWKMVYKEILFGFTIAGFIAVFVPKEFWNALFLQAGENAPSLLAVVENALVAPVVAFFTFIGSMGNVPLAAMLWSKNASFGGVMSFLGADLVAATVIYVHAKYYGWRYAAYLSGLLYVCMVAAGVTVHALFAVLGILPTERPSLQEMVRFQIDYTFWLNIAFALIAILLFAIHWQGGEKRREAHA